ncbi:MAG: hypothetical protein JRG91_14960 [Deltaproteobacteria bacterium]|nr:hypothetical protein [Deltaproteobacteria bacterium]
MSSRWALFAAMAIAGCGKLLGPPVTCTVEPMPPTPWGEERPDHRDIVCTAEKALKTYRVHIEYEDHFGPRSEHFGHHGVDEGEVDHHTDVEVGSVVTIEVEGYRNRRFTVR